MIKKESLEKRWVYLRKHCNSFYLLINYFKNISKRNEYSANRKNSDWIGSSIPQYSQPVNKKSRANKCFQKF